MAAVAEIKVSALRKLDAGLDLVNNWGATSATNDASNTTYATAGAVKKAYDLAATKLAANANAVSATKLATARQINGTDFDGSGNITTANWGTARTLTIGNAAKSVNGAGNVSWSLAEIGAVSKGGDQLTGGLTFANADCELGWDFNSDYAKIGFKNTADGDSDSYMWFKTGDNGNEYFKWQTESVGGATTTDWMSLKPTGLVVAAGVTAPTFTGALVGNAATATKLATARTLTVGLTGKTFDGTANVAWSLAEIGAVKDNVWFAQVKLGTWSAICEFQIAGTLGGKAIVTVGHTRGDAVVNAMFLVSFGHAGNASITQLESHGYTQIKVRPAMIDANNIRFEILDDTAVSDPMGAVVAYTVRVDNLFGVLYPFTAFTASTGTPKVEVSTEWKAIKVNNNKVYHEGFKPTAADVGLGQVVNAPQIQSVFANGYWGMVASTGNAAEWIRTPLPGIIPYTSTSGGVSSLGTIAWPFLDAHVGTVYEGGRSLAEKYLSLTGGQLSNGLTIANSSASSNLLSLLNEGDGWTWIKFGKSAHSAGQGHFAWSTQSAEGHPVNAFHLRPGGSITTLSVAGDVVTLRGDVPLDFQGNSTWGGKLRVGGNGRTAPDDGLMASVVSSNGNLHLDSASGKELYLNHYVGESIAFGDGAKGVVGRITKDGDFSVNRNGAFGGTLAAKSICTGWDSGIPGAVSCSNWFRSSGDSGWFSATHGGGIHMQDSTWVRIYNAKKLHVENADNDSIYTLGGVKAEKGFIGDLTGNARSATFLNGQSSSVGVTSLVNRLNSGFYEDHQTTQANGWPVDGGRYHMMCATHSNGDNYFSMQFAADFFNSNNLFYRATCNNGLTVWNRVWHSGNFDPVAHGHTIGSVAGLQSALNAKADCPGGSISFGGNSNAITTAQFIELLTSLGAFSSSGYWTARGSWAYAANQVITDTGLGHICLAGAVVEVIGPVTSYTIRITTPTTTSGGGLAEAEFIYVNNGSAYAPGWRRSFNTSNPPTAAQVGAMAESGSYGTVYMNNWFRSTGPTGWYNETYGGGIHMQDSTWVRTFGNKKFHIANGEGDALNVSGGIYAGGSGSFADVTIRSDRNLKSNFQAIEDGLGKVLQLTGQIYDKQLLGMAGVVGVKREAGLIAQDVEAVLPLGVHRHDDGYLSISQTGLNALFVEAIKGLADQIAQLRSAFIQEAA
ncbi:tail fiber domain-containing protein [Aeromonas rivipollensis]|uniref:tail fiber domain-containing protein n=1 Tax=Aeromonas rivipollensis TaxID=948519 RepID=UPI0038D1C858